METKIIFLEGQPGTGKSTVSQFVSMQLQLHGESIYWLDEYEHSDKYFGKFWENYETNNEDLIEVLLVCWKNLIKEIENSEMTFIMDSSFFSYTLYLLNLEFSTQIIENYFITLNDLLSRLNPKVIFLKGDTEKIVGRACTRRGEHWTNYTIEMVENCPYQKNKNRTGFDGMIAYFTDAERLYTDLMPLNKFPTLTLDVTDEKWEINESKILSWIGYRKIENHYDLKQASLMSYIGKYQVPENFPAKDEKLEIVLENKELVLKGKYWKDYKLVATSETHFLVKGIPMEVDFILQNGECVGIDYTFVDRKNYSCIKYT